MSAAVIRDQSMLSKVIAGRWTSGAAGIGPMIVAPSGGVEVSKEVQVAPSGHSKAAATPWLASTKTMEIEPKENVSRLLRMRDGIAEVSWPARAVATSRV
jgi:hypothetical protein